MQVFLGYPPEYVKTWIENNTAQLTTGGKWTDNHGYTYVRKNDIMCWEIETGNVFI